MSRCSAIEMLSTNIPLIDGKLFLALVALTPIGIIERYNCKIVSQRDLRSFQRFSIEIVSGILSHLSNESLVGVTKLAFMRASGTSLRKIFGVIRFEQFGMLGIFFQKPVLISKCMIGGPLFTTELDSSQKKLPHLTRRLEILVFHHGPFKRISTDSILQIRSSSYLRNRELKFRLLRNNYIHRMRPIKSDTNKFFKKVIYRITSALCIINRRKYKFYLTGCIVYQLRVVYFQTIFRRGDTIIIPAVISIGIFILPHKNDLIGRYFNKIFLLAQLHGIELRSIRAFTYANKFGPVRRCIVNNRQFYAR